MLRASHLILPAIAIAMSGCGGGQVPAPKSFAKFDAPDGTFSVEYPEGWEAKGGAPSGSGYSWAKFTKGNAQIKVDTGQAGSLLGDISKSTQTAHGHTPDPDEIVKEIHEFERDGFADDYSSFKEQLPVTVPTAGMGPAVCSIFFADSVMGVRATALGHNHRIRIVCTCPPSNWKILRPAFEKVVASLKR